MLFSGNKATNIRPDDIVPRQKESSSAVKSVSVAVSHGKNHIPLWFKEATKPQAISVSLLAYFRPSEHRHMSSKSKPRSSASRPQSRPLKALTGQKPGALHPGDSVQTAGNRMRQHDAETWPVAENRKLVGGIEEKNLDWRLGGQGHDPRAWRVGEIMSRDLVFCFEDEDCEKALRLMEERDMQFLPVVDRELHIIGIFSRKEIRSATTQ